jgi:cytochrome c peroxidase
MSNRLPSRSVATGTFACLAANVAAAPDPAAVELGKALFIEPRLSEGHNIGGNTCHNLSTGAVGLGGNSYQPFGVVEKPDWSILPPADKGRFAVMRAEADAYVFKVPTLRTIALTPPYFHSGSVWDLTLAVGIMGTSQMGATLEVDQEACILAFLDGLTGDMPQITYPTLPPSTADTPRPQQ